MKRKMIWVGVSWLLGLSLATSLSSPLERPMTLWLLPAVWMLLGGARLCGKMRTKEMLIAGCSLTIAFAWVCIYTAFFYFPVMRYDGQTVTFFGRVTAAAVYDNDWSSYQVHGTFPDGTLGKVVILTQDLGLNPGDKLEITGQFSAPEDSTLWNGRAYYRAKGIFLEADSDCVVSGTKTALGRLYGILAGYRGRIARRITALAGKDAGGMVAAMLLGDRTGLASDTEDAFAQTGVSHVLSVSGLHLVLLLSVWHFACKRLSIHRVLAFMGCLVWIIFYTLLVGAPVTILRAGLMYLILQAAPLFYRRGDAANSICIAGVLLTLGQPYLIRDASFLLSLSGTCGVAVFAPWMTKQLSRKHFYQRMRNSLLCMCCVSLSVLPVTILYFSSVSIVSPIANLILVPLASVLLLCSLVVFLTGGLAFFAGPFCFLMRYLYSFMMLFCHGILQIFPRTLPTGWELMPLLVLILLGYVITLLWLRRRQRRTALAIAMSILLLILGQSVYQSLEARRFHLTLCGDTQEGVLILSYGGETDVLDLTGDSDNPAYVERYLSAAGIETLDSLSLTKRSNQMRVAYDDTLSNISVAECAVPSDCLLFERTLCRGATPVQTDSLHLEGTAYTLTQMENGYIVEFSGLRFFVGTVLSALPEEPCDGIFCTEWRGDAGFLENHTVYEKAELIALRVTPSGDMSITMR